MKILLLTTYFSIIYGLLAVTHPESEEPARGHSRSALPMPAEVMP